MSLLGHRVEENRVARSSKLIEMFNAITSNQKVVLKELYHEDITFIDPAHQISGLEQFTDYLDSLYQNVIECGFELEHSVEEGDESIVFWNMTLKHKRLAGGQSITLEGMSRIKWQQDKIIYHRDYFDLGAMVYEHLPLIGRMVQWVKRKLGQ